MQHQPLAWRKRRYHFVQRFGTACWTILLFALCATTARPSELAAANAKMPSAAGDKRLHTAIAAQKGRPVLVNFWATWCEPCREEMPSLHRLAKRWLERGLVVITVAVADDKQRVTNYLEGIGMPFAVIHDQDQTINQLWGAYAVPTTLILDAHHRIRLRGLGAIDWDDPAIDQQLKAALN